MSNVLFVLEMEKNGLRNTVLFRDGDEARHYGDSIALYGWNVSIRESTTIESCSGNLYSLGYWSQDYRVRYAGFNSIEEMRSVLGLA